MKTIHLITLFAIISSCSSSNKRQSAKEYNKMAEEKDKNFMDNISHMKKYFTFIL